MDEPPGSVEEAVRRACERAESLWREPLSREELYRICRELRRLSKAHRRLWVANRADASRPEVFRELIRRTGLDRRQEPRERLRWALLALEVAEALPTAAVPSGIRADALAEARAAECLALRELGELRDAEEALSKAAKHAAHGTGDPLIAAQLDHHLGLLRRRQGRCDEAVSLIARSIRQYEQIGDAEAVSSHLIALAVAHHEAGNLGGAARATVRALENLDSQRFPSLVLQAANNLSFYLLQLGKVDDATDCFQAVRRGFGKSRLPTQALRLSWLEAKLAHATGRRVKAQALLDQVRRGFAELEMAYDSALAGLELALRYAEAGRPADVERLATEMYPIFISADLPSEAAATLMLFVQAVDDQAAHPARIQELLGSLETQRYSAAD